MTRDVARRLLLGTAPAVLGVVVAGGTAPACYSAGAGTEPPPNNFYFPVGLAVSKGGNVLYAVNSDFDLQWNGGTLQSYDLFGIRRDAAKLIAANSGNPPPDPTQFNHEIKFLVPWQPGCLTMPRVSAPNGSRVPVGEACSPPVDSTRYV